MLAIFGCMLAGVLSGYLLRRFRVGWVGKFVTLLIWVLLFLLGVEVGGNDEVIGNLPTLGVEGAIIALSSIIGSCLMAMLLWKFAKRRGTGEA